MNRTYAHWTPNREFHIQHILDWIESDATAAAICDSLGIYQDIDHTIDLLSSDEDLINAIKNQKGPDKNNNKNEKELYDIKGDNILAGGNDTDKDIPVLVLALALDNDTIGTTGINDCNFGSFGYDLCGERYCVFADGYTNVYGMYRVYNLRLPILNGSMSKYSTNYRISEHIGMKGYGCGLLVIHYYTESDSQAYEGVSRLLVDCHVIRTAPAYTINGKSRKVPHTDTDSVVCMRNVTDDTEVVFLEYVRCHDSLLFVVMSRGQYQRTKPVLIQLPISTQGITDVDWGPIKREEEWGVAIEYGYDRTSCSIHRHIVYIWVIGNLLTCSTLHYDPIQYRVLYASCPDQYHSIRHACVLFSRSIHLRTSSPISSQPHALPSSFRAVTFDIEDGEMVGELGELDELIATLIGRKSITTLIGKSIAELDLVENVVRLTVVSGELANVCRRGDNTNQCLISSHDVHDNGIGEIAYVTLRLGNVGLRSHIMMDIIRSDINCVLLYTSLYTHGEQTCIIAPNLVGMMEREWGAFTMHQNKHKRPTDLSNVGDVMMIWGLLPLTQEPPQAKSLTR